MYGYIYKTTNLVNGKIYIGKKKGEFTTSYKGSGKYLKNALNKYGVENFSVEVIEYCETLDIQNEREKYWISYYRNLDTPMYNIANGGDGGDLVTCLPDVERIKFKNHISELNKAGIIGNKGRYLSEQHKKKIGAGNKGKIHNQDWINKQRQAVLGKTAWNKGLSIADERVRKYARKPGTFHHSEETKQKLSMKLKGTKPNIQDKELWKSHISNALKGKKKSPEHAEKCKRVAIGRIWVNNEVQSKMIYPEELNKYIKLGYNKGRGKLK